jgi:hypothetical protein
LCSQRGYFFEVKYNLVTVSQGQEKKPVSAREEVKSMSILQLPGLAGYQAFAVLQRK